MKKYLSSLISHFSFQRGFSLVELLVAIGIIGILASFLLANFVGVRERARDSVRKSDLRQIQSALEFYRSDNSTYPAPLPDCGTSLTGGSTIYMKKIPCDPSADSGYDYSVGSGNTTYSLIACLENDNDSDIDEDGSGNKIACSDPTLWQYTVEDP